jgi:pimeloyl-ACP methyl ester carboxylesterase
VAEVGAWVAWLKGEGAKRVVLLGHSRGGTQVAWYATEQPDPAVAGLVLMAPPEVDAVELAASYRKTFEREPGPVLEQAQALAAKGQGGELMSPVGILYCPDTSATADALLSYHAFDPRMDTPTLAERLTVPTLVVVAGADDITPGLDEAFAPAAKAGKVRILVIDGADHFFRDLYAEEAADVIAEFIDTL